MQATLDDAVLALVRVALGTASSTDTVGPVDDCLLLRAARLGVVEQVIAAGAIVGFTDEAESMAASITRARVLRGAQAATMACRIQRMLRDAQIPVLLLKGVALAATTGRDPAERAGIDTDVLVRPVDWPRVHDVLVASGYRLDRRVPPPRARDSLTRFMTFSSYEAAYAGPGGPVDVHWRLVPGHVVSLSATALLERSVEVELAGATITTLDPDAMLAHVALHGAKDSWRSARTLVDAHLLVEAGGATWAGAASLVGRSSAVSHLKAAVASGLTDAGTSRPPDFDAIVEPASVWSFLRHRVTLTPSAASLISVAGGLLVPRQMVVRSPIPRRVWWLIIGPRSARVVWRGVRGGAKRAGATRIPTPTRGSGSRPSPPAPPMSTTLHRRWRDAGSFARDLVSWYGGTSSGADTYRVARKVHVRTAGVSSAALFGAMRAVPGATDHVPRDQVIRARSRSGGALDDLRKNGLAVIAPILDDDAVARLRAFAEHAPARLQLADGTVVDGTYADRPPDTTLVSIPGVFTWADGDVQHVMASQRLHDLALARFGLAPVVQLPNLYWSCVPADPDIDGTQRRVTKFHVDFDGVQAIRVHMYLTDVDAGSAPMEYVRGSHRVGSQHGRAFRNADNGLDDDVVARRFGTAPAQVVTGPAGTTFVSDPRGLHRATPPRDHDRLFLVTAVRAGAFAGSVRRPRAIPVRDEDFRQILDVPRGPLRLFEAIHDEDEAGISAVRVARLA